MAKPRAVPDPDSRESPQLWFRMIDASGKRRQRVNEESARFMRWHRGDLRDLIDPNATNRWESGLENHTNNATVASLADIFFRCPRFVVKVPGVRKRKPLVLPGQAPPPPEPSDRLFSTDLAAVETEMLRQTLDHANFFEKATRALQDALLADMGVLKVTHDADVVVNEEDIAAAVKEADDEIKQFLAGNLKAMWATEEQLHSVHIERKGQLLAMAQRGETILESTAIRYLRDHLRVHEAMKGSERPTETIRSNQIRIARINPVTDYFYDPTVDDRSQATWRASRFLMRKADLLDKSEYDAAAVEQVRECQDRWEPRSYQPSLTSAGSYDIPEEMVMVYEVFDLVDQKRILFADGTTIPLKFEDRGELASLQPSGPFHELVFMADSMEGQGIPPPMAYKAEQAAATHIATSNVQAAIQSQPKTMFNARDIDPAQAKRIWDAKAGEFIPVEPKGELSKPLEACFAQVPASEIHEQNIVVLDRCESGINKRSGLGVSKMGGGEEAATATGAALGADASSSISEDRGAKCDRWSRGVARDALRLDRRLTPYSMWVEQCGPVAIEVLPPPSPTGACSFSIREACNDIGVDVMPGSSRRRNTAVDQKQVTDLAVAAAGMPMMQGPAGQKAILKMVRQIAEDAGVADPGWDDVEQEIDMMAMQAQMMGQPPGAAPAEGEGGPDGSRSDETDGVAPNDIEQGVANPGAGRVGTGASVGDRIATNRSEAVNRQAQRGS